MGEYIKHTWVDDEVIDAPKLNNIEEGIAEAKKEAEKVNTVAGEAKDAAAAAQQTAGAAQTAANEAKTNVTEHNVSEEAHADLRAELQKLANSINSLLNTDESTLAEMQEMIDYINSNKDLIEEISTSKVNVADIVNNLVTNVANKPLSAAQGVVLKGLIDTLQAAVDKKAAESDLTSHTGNAENPHNVTKAQVGLGNVDNTSDTNKPVSTAQAAAIADAKKAGTDAQANLTAHNTNTGAHADLRAELKALTDRINAALDSDDTTLDELSEIVAYIKSNKSLIDAITTSKVNVSDIVDNLVTNVANKPLSAAQGVVLKGLIDTLQTAVNGKAPTSHAATSTTYGAGSGSNYGHVKLSDATNGTSNVNGGVAATPAAVKAAYDLANSANTNKVNVSDIVNDLVSNVAKKPLSAAQGVVLKGLIDAITTSKVNVSDIVNNLATNVTNKPLSAAQGVVLKGLIDALQTSVNGGAKVESGTYTGTLTDQSGRSFPSSLTFSFTPKLIVFFASGGKQFMILGETYGWGTYYQTNWKYEQYEIVSWGTTVTWYADISDCPFIQMDDSGYNYAYVAIG